MTTAAECDLLLQLIEDLDQVTNLLAWLDCSRKNEFPDTPEENSETADEASELLWQQLALMHDRLRHARGDSCLYSDDDGRTDPSRCKVAEDHRRWSDRVGWPLAEPVVWRN